jgi:hypothetical protein
LNASLQADSVSTILQGYASSMVNNTVSATAALNATLIGVNFGSNYVGSNVAQPLR